MQVLVVGGAGFIGSHLVRALIAREYKVLVLDALTRQIHGSIPSHSNLPPQVHFIHGDVQFHDLSRVVAEVDAVVHLAAETGVSQSMYQVERYVNVNQGGTARLLQALLDRAHPVQRFVLASSRAVYGEGAYRCARCGIVYPPPRRKIGKGAWDPACPSCQSAIEAIPTHEDTPARPTSIYAITKHNQEQLCFTIGDTYGLRPVALRYFNVYGPGQSLSNPYTGILSSFFVRFKAGMPVDVYEDGHEQRDFVYISDVVDATVRALEAPGETISRQVFNVGSGHAISILELAHLLRELMGSSSPINITFAFRSGDVRHAIADTRVAERVLGFKARVGLAEGLSRWLRWAQSIHVTDRTTQARNELAQRGLYRSAQESI